MIILLILFLRRSDCRLDQDRMELIIFVYDFISYILTLKKLANLILKSDFISRLMIADSLVLNHLLNQRVTLVSMDVLQYKLENVAVALKLFSRN